MTLSATAGPTARTIGTTKLPVRTFRISVGFTSYDVALDAAGWPVETPAHARID